MKSVPFQTVNATHRFYTRRNPISILLIEDSRTDVVLIRKMLRDILEHESFHITDVPRMAEALELLDKDPYDIVLLDLDLLDIVGVASVAALHAEIPNIPIVVYSGTSDLALREQALMCGAKYYLVKGSESAFSLRHLIETTLVQQAS